MDEILNALLFLLIGAVPAGPERELISTVTYAVVVFSILGQELTIPALLRKAVAAQES